MTIILTFLTLTQPLDILQTKALKDSQSADKLSL